MKRLTNTFMFSTLPIICGSKYSYLFSLLLVLCLISPTVQAQNSGLGVFDQQADIGNPKISGQTLYDSEKQEYTIRGSGSNMWEDHDEFHFTWKKLSGDFIIRTKPRFLDEAGHPHRKLGIIIRSGLQSDAAYVDVAIHADGLTSMQFRETPGDSTKEIKSTVTNPEVIQIERRGSNYIMSVAKQGETFNNKELNGIALGDELYAGLFVCSHDSTQTTRAAFDNVRIVKPAPDDLVPYQDYLGSRLEILNVDTGKRKIIHQSEKSLQAPNWTPDGQALIYNSEGKLYRFDLKTQTPKVINTGFADQNNNDHVLSFDGSKLGISHHPESHDGNSIIYTLPTSGGTPNQITPQGPSYLHGWSPDGKWLTYTAQRNGEFDIYKIPAAGGKEIRLTSAEGLDDGPEYSPDGKYIYFNSVRSGKMEIWRMHPDGSNKEQLTDDRFNNWFPHISPNGKRMIFLSFGPNVDPGNHPFYKRVYLRVMPVDGGSPRTVAYVYGGQGTINVPSWSPDGTRVAFISNSGSITLSK